MLSSARCLFILYLPPERKDSFAYYLFLKRNCIFPSLFGCILELLDYHLVCCLSSPDTAARPATDLAPDSSLKACHHCPSVKVIQSYISIGRVIATEVVLPYYPDPNVRVTNENKLPHALIDINPSISSPSRSRQRGNEGRAGRT